MYFYERATLEKDQLEKEIRLLKDHLAKAPSGSLQCHRNGNSYKWYLTTVKGGKRKYLPKSKKALAEQLAQKAYERERLKRCERDLRAIERYLKQCTQNCQYEKSLLRKESGFRALLKEKLSFLAAEDLRDKWMEEAYRRNEKYPEHLTHRAVGGLMVRSKSEAIIAQILHTEGIPFRYECEQIFNGIAVYPDFTILHPISGKMILWEHWGLMDQETYRSTTFRKLETYIDQGFIPGDNLILTWESGGHPLDVTLVMDIVEHYFKS